MKKVEYQRFPGNRAPGHGDYRIAALQILVLVPLIPSYARSPRVRRFCNLVIRSNQDSIEFSATLKALLRS